MTSRLALVALCMLLASCGGGAEPATTPATPASTPAPAFAAGTIVSFVSGETDQPARGAAVTVGPANHLTDPSGQIVIGATAPSGTQMTVVADGFLDRRVLLRSSHETRFTLWPRVSSLTREPTFNLLHGPDGLDEAWTAELVYTTSCSMEKSYPLAAESLYRMRSGVTIPVSIAPGPLRRPAVEEALQRAVDLLNQANEGRVMFRVEGSPASRGIQVELLDSPELQASRIAQMTVTTDGEGYITGGRLQFIGDPVQRADWEATVDKWWFLGETEYFLVVIAHELGHALGLGHAYVDLTNRTVLHWGLMATYAEGSRCTGGADFSYYPRTGDFSPAEKLALKLMHQRKPGNTFPDNEAGVKPARAGETIVVCRMAAD